MDKNVYLEYYRKTSKLKDNNNKTPDPTVINIKKITREAGEFRLKVSLFYQLEDTHRGSSFAESKFSNKIFFMVLVPETHFK